MSFQPDSLNAQFSHMTLAQQPHGDGAASAPDARHYPAMYHHHHHPVVLQGAPPQQIGSYVVAGPSGGHPGVQSVPFPTPAPTPTPAYPGNTPGPAAYPGPTLNQPILQQHTYIQQPVQQVGPLLIHTHKTSIIW